MGIKYRNSDLDRLQRTVDNFNAKIRRAAARGVEGLPETVRIRDLKSEIGSRADFNRTVNQLQRFSRRGAETTIINDKGLAMTQWEKREMMREVGIINARRAVRMKDAAGEEATSRGKSLGMKRGEMGSERLNALKPKKFNFNSFRSRSEIKEYKKSIKHQVKSDFYKNSDARYQANYIQALRNTFGSKADKLVAKVQSMSPAQFAKYSLKEQEADIKTIYNPVDNGPLLSAIMQAWNVEDIDGRDMDFMLE